MSTFYYVCIYKNNILHIKDTTFVIIIFHSSIMQLKDYTDFYVIKFTLYI